MTDRRPLVVVTGAQQEIASGDTLPTAILGSGTANSTVFLRGDQTWAAPAGGVSSVSGTAPIASSGGSTPAISIAAATTSAAGSMSAADKTKLDGVASGATANTGTVTTASVVSANGFAGSVANATTTPAITISTSITGILKGNATAISAATAGTDYAVAGSSTTWTAAQTFDGGIVITNSIQETPVVANTSTNYTVDLANGTVFDLTLNANWSSPTFPTATAGRQFTLILKQDSTGGRTVSWPSGTVRWPSGTAPTLSALNKTDVISFLADGTYWLGFVGGLNYTRA